MQNVFTKALVGVETSNFEFPLVTKDGARVQILLNATTRRDEQNRVIGVVGIGQDITARIAQEQEYSRLIETANAPIFGIDRDGLVNVWNTCASNLTGFGAARKSNLGHPRDTRDRVERAAPHSDPERPRIEGRLKFDFLTAGRRELLRAVYLIGLVLHPV